MIFNYGACNECEREAERTEACVLPGRVSLLAQARLYQLRGTGRTDFGHASGTGRAKTLDFRTTIPPRTELLHAASRPGSSTTRNLYRLALAPHMGRYRCWRAIRIAVAVHLDRTLMGLYGIR